MVKVAEAWGDTADDASSATDGACAEPPTVTWDHVAAMLDRLCFPMFLLVIIAMTTTLFIFLAISRFKI